MVSTKYVSHAACALVLLGLPSVSGCVFDEGLVIENLEGTVVLPAAAVTREFTREDGSVDVVEDARLIGPVYLGLFASVEPAESIERYPHPEIGPQIKGKPGDTYPYGGTTVGDLRYACFEFLACKVASGRYEDFDSLVAWFADVLQTPITDAAGTPLEDGEYIRQTCYNLLDVTSDEEVHITGQLDFKKRADGDYEAPFTIWQQDFVEGFSLWGFMDAPSLGSFKFSTCDPTEGVFENEYDADFNGGRVEPDVLNLPANYISDGDWTSDGYKWTDPQAKPELVIDFEVL